MISAFERYQRASEDDPFLLLTTGSTFGGPDDKEDNGLFAFGGGSILGDGTINPENYAAVPAELYDEGIVQPGQKFRVTNPQTGAVTIVVARDKGPSAKNRGIDLAPHAMMELGADTDQPLVVDFRPITELEEKVMHPFTLDGTPDMSLSSVAPEAPAPEAGDVFDPSGLGLSTLTPIGSNEPEMTMASGPQSFTPNQGILSAAKGRSSAPTIVETKDDGTVVFDDGTTVYANGIVEKKVGQDAYHYVPGKAAPVIKRGKLSDQKSMEQISDEAAARKGILREDYATDEDFENAKKGALNTSGNVKPSADITKRVIQGVNAITGLESLVQERERAPEIGMFEKALLAKQEAPSAGFLDSITRQWAQAQVSKDALALETLRKRINSMIIFAQGGQSLTNNEKAALTIVEPDDSKEAALIKIRVAAPLLRKELSHITNQFPGAFPEAEVVLGATIAPKEGEPKAPDASPNQDRYKTIFDEAKRRLQTDPNDEKAKAALERLRRLGYNG